MTAPTPTRGAVYDCVGALAIYWPPDQHPCGNNRPEPWLILHDVGHIEWVAELSQGHLVDYLSGFEPKPPRPASKRARAWAQDMPARLVQAAANVLPAAYDRSCGVPADLISRTTSDPEDWIPEAREVVAAVLRELTRADCPRTITALDIRFWANKAEETGQ